MKKLIVVAASVLVFGGGSICVGQDADDPVECVSDLATHAKSGEIQLIWTHTDADHYNIYRGTVSGGPYPKIASTTSSFSTYLDSTVVNGTTYYYVVRPADNLDAEECQSNEASGTPSRPRR